MVNVPMHLIKFSFKYAWVYFLLGFKLRFSLQKTVTIFVLFIEISSLNSFELQLWKYNVLHTKCILADGHEAQFF
jgi:hypothetical protein